MIHVAYLVHSLQAGGIERSVTRIVNLLDPARFQASIICLEKTGPAQDWLSRDVPIIEIGKRSGNDLGAIRRLAAALRKQQVDIVQSHNWGTLVEAVIARKLSRTPFHVHAERGTVLGMVEGRGLRHWLRARAMAMSLANVDRVVSNSRTVAARVQQRCGFRQQQIVIIPNGVPDLEIENRCEVRRQVRADLNVDPDSVLIGSVGRLVDVKGFDLAISAFAETLAQHPSAHLLIVGGGPDHEKLSAIASKQAIADRVHLVGQRDDVGNWLAAMDVYFNSSRSEGMSQSIIEAMAAGLPIVATDVGDSADVIGAPDTEAAGIIVPAGDSNQLADAFSRLAADPTRRQNYGSQSHRRHRERFSQQQLADNCESLYQNLIHGGSSQ